MTLASILSDTATAMLFAPVVAGQFGVTDPFELIWIACLSGIVTSLTQAWRAA